MRDMIKLRAAQKRWREANREKLSQDSLRYQRAHREQTLKNHRRYKWSIAGVVVEEAEAAILNHSGFCDCCGSSKLENKSWHVDHDHKSGKIRGILCHKCNLGIGLLGDTLTGVQRAVTYLGG